VVVANAAGLLDARVVTLTVTAAPFPAWRAALPQGPVSLWSQASVGIFWKHDTGNDTGYTESETRTPLFRITGQNPGALQLTCVEGGGSSAPTPIDDDGSFTVGLLANPSSSTRSVQYSGVLTANGSVDVKTFNASYGTPNLDWATGSTELGDSYSSIVMLATSPGVGALPATMRVLEGANLSFFVPLAGPEGADLTVTTSPLPAGALYGRGAIGDTEPSVVEPLFSWTPLPGQAATYAVTFTVRGSPRTVSIEVTPNLQGFRAALPQGPVNLSASTSFPATGNDSVPVSLTLGGTNPGDLSIRATATMGTTSQAGVASVNWDGSFYLVLDATRGSYLTGRVEYPNVIAITGALVSVQDATAGLLGLGVRASLVP
jgi:hypothetical protein